MCCDRLATNDELDAFLRTRSHPLFLQDIFLRTGRSQFTPNGTGSFIKYKGRHYLCTNHHVVKLLQDPSVMNQAKHPVVALMLGKVVINFSAYPPHRGTSPFYTPELDPEIDIAIADVEGLWELIQIKGKAAVDLDAWQEPRWAELGLCVTSGFLNDTKLVNANMLETQRVMIVAHMSSSINVESREFTLQSTLEHPHGYFFSGISGSPIFATINREYVCPIGIVQEASPSSRNVSEQEGSFFTPSDIVVRGICLTPQRFSGWLDHTPLRRYL